MSWNNPLVRKRNLTPTSNAERKRMETPAQSKI